MSVPAADLKPLLAQVAVGRPLSESEAEAAFDIIMSGNATPSQIGAFLMGLRVRGETVDEITGAARIMRAKALAIDAPPGTIDTVGADGGSAGPARRRAGLGRARLGHGRTDHCRDDDGRRVQGRQGHRIRGRAGASRHKTGDDRSAERWRAGA